MIGAISALMCRGQVPLIFYKIWWTEVIRSCRVFSQIAAYIEVRLRREFKLKCNDW